MTSALENKLNASMQSPRRRSTTAKSPVAAESESTSKTAASLSSKARVAKTAEASSDLNAGGGRELNPQRIWPD